MKWVTCIHYPNNHSSREEDKNDITKATFASSSSLLDFGRQCKGSSNSRAAPKAKHEERLIKIWLIAQMRYSLESCCSFGSPFPRRSSILILGLKHFLMRDRIHRLSPCWSRNPLSLVLLRIVEWNSVIAHPWDRTFVPCGCALLPMIGPGGCS